MKLEKFLTWSKKSRELDVTGQLECSREWKFLDDFLKQLIVIGQSTWMGQLGRLSSGDSWSDLTNYNSRLRKGHDLMRLIRHLVIFKSPESFQVVLCHNCNNLSCSSQIVYRNWLLWWAWCVMRFWHACALGCDVLDSLKLATCVGDAIRRVEACDGMTNFSPDWATWLLI